MTNPYHTNPATLPFAAGFAAALAVAFAFPTVSSIGVPDRVLVPAGNRTARLLPASQWNETSQTLSWWKPDGGGLDRAYSDNFLIIFVETL